MKKLAITAAAVLAAVFLGTGTAHALVPGVDIMDTEVGYGYNAAKDGIHSAHIEIKPIPKVVVGAEYRHWNHAGNETDVYAKYKIGHLYIGAGNRNYYDRDAKLFGLVEGRANVLGPVDMQASKYPAKNANTKQDSSSISYRHRLMWMSTTPTMTEMMSRTKAALASASTITSKSHKKKTACSRLRAVFFYFFI